ncbi:MAG TPA: pantoate--beta-alanine ligase [Candidatus Baltobacteraceae bacterium]|nr:pantoate--beta-alanine ligase [Candidatus Baltobacteraceae bacterium]
MHVASAAPSARERLAALPRPLGFVPTMGALHAGHLQLVQTARARCASVAASVFVNPTQFGPGEDFERYPRDYEGDRSKLAQAGVDLLFAPEAQTMYPPGFSTGVDVGEIGTTFEGAIRPAHFRGVATVVTKLLNVIRPDVLYLGQKDAQQTAVLRKVVRDLDFAVSVTIVPTVREPDGLALSSRNAYLTPEQRAAAPSLHRALETMLAQLRAGSDAAAARERALGVLDAPGAWDYLDVVDMDMFAPLQRLQAPAFVIGAARFGATRLLDNLIVPDDSNV